MLLVVGASLFQTTTSSLVNGLLATLFGAGLFGWGVLTRVRRRAIAGAATVAFASFLLVTVPIARLLPAVHGPVLWLSLAAVGLTLLLVASTIERGRIRAQAAARRIDELLVGWE
jgi:peptidoglycan/LPS O-acetylase OafA/YrhL